ncbi:DNA-binding protein [Streptomyces capitiformicae]|uniref:DNA-binding protein n=1 Tax=Streptomyces capitiformicae TaxID=2014920 RepID=A0A918ZG16_9ACTN|nr:DNA-binding protein [Streptomyces capitiformicae]GHE50722.1 DNA-binding protein [Streptomyces capitiformicae]
MSGGTRVSYEELLAAGGVLPPDTEGAGERAVPLTARTYRHPGLDDRVVVRLVAGELGAAEDLATGFLGLERDAEPAVVGLGLRQSLGFPEWVLVHHPEDGHRALGVVPDLEKVARQAKSKPKAAMDACLELGTRLAASVPHFLPTFYEQAGRVFLAEENAAYAAQLFTRARKAEAEHGLVVDEERLDAVFLEFALAGALPVKVLSAYAKELAARVPAEEALRRFTRLCLRRTAGGLPPSAQMANDLRKLARAAGRDADLTEQEYLAELLGLPATLRAAAGWWKGHRTALVALAGREPRVRGALLDIVPSVEDDEMPALWLGVLEASGALAGLWDTSLPAEERSSDGTAGWLQRFLKFRQESRCATERLAELYALVDRTAEVLRAELTASGGELRATEDLDLLDQLLSLDVPVAAPGKNSMLLLAAWAKGEGQRELLSLAADSRFHEAFRKGADHLGDNVHGLRAIRLLAASPGGRPMLAEWVRAVVRRFTVVGLPQLPDALTRLKWLPAKALALAEEEVREAVATDLAPVLARTLRTGIVDELGWPAWEEATADLVPKNDVEDIVVADAWPHLIVAGAAQARVIGAEGTVLTHDLRAAVKDSWGDPGFHHVDGELLVHWRTRNDGLRGYWHTRADRELSLKGPDSTRGTQMDWYRGDFPITLPLPGGGRATGSGVLHAGDTTVPEERPMVSDGVSYWLWHTPAEDGETSGFFEYDPVTGELGRRSMPAFFTDALRDAPEGSTFQGGWLGPSPTPGATPASAPVDGLIGLRQVRLPDGSRRTEDLAGHTVTLPADMPWPSALVVFPGADRAVAVVRGSWQLDLVDSEGVVTAVTKTDRTPGVFGEGTLLLPPVQYWECMTPRDPEGSEALRRIDRDTSAALLKAAAQPDEKALPDAIRALLPVTHDALVAGIAGVVRHAAGQQAVLDAAATRLTRALDGDLEDEGPVGVPDVVLLEALNGLGVVNGYWWNRDKEVTTVFRALRVMARAAGLTDTAVPEERTARLHLDGPGLHSGQPEMETLVDRVRALSFRAAAGTTSGKHREALRTLLGEFDALGLGATATPQRWRKVELSLAADLLRSASGDWREGAWRGLLPLGGGAFIVFVERESTHESDEGYLFTGFFHDPTGRFEIPEPYTLRKSSPLGEDTEAGRLGAFLAELDTRGPAPWFPEAAEEFARLTGVTETMARLIVAGLPQVDVYERTFLTAEARGFIGVKAAAAADAKSELARVDGDIRVAVVAALLPADPARLWTEGPDAAAAAEVWNSRVGKRTPVPEALFGEAVRAVKHSQWEVREALPALLDPAAEPRFTQDLDWAVSGDRVKPVGGDMVGFTAETLVGTVALAAWLAHRLPAGDPIRAALPPALSAVRRRLAHPGLVLDLGRYINLPKFRKTAGAPAETGKGFERYGAVVLATHDDQPAPGLRVALLDEAGQDPYLPALRIDDQRPFTAEVALRLARSPRFAALLADPGDPLAGERDKDGVWWPQDPSRSVPELVTEVAKEYGIGEDAATVYLMLLAMPDPTDRLTARWTGWKPARIKAARAELAATDLVVEATRTRASRSLFLPGGWVELTSPRVPLERWKLPLYAEVMHGETPTFSVVVPTEPHAELYRRAWQRVQDGDAPRFEELQVRKRGRRR